MGDVLAGADDNQATSRAGLFGRQRPRHTGCIARRGLVSAARLIHLELSRINGVL
jgi:hypothetical protein